jgi:hypothetical protein
MRMHPARPILRCISIISLCWAFTCRAQQDATATAKMEGELCGCMSMIDQRINDRALETEVRTCLENAVVHHPAAIRSLLQRDGAGDTKGYQVGLLLGRHLEDRCPAFRPIQQRLRRINEASAVQKSPS